MIIKSIEINDFRIYYGENEINLTPGAEKNVILVSGKNGFGKTTFLISLVWCLYGRQMEEVDELYRKEIKAAEGYSRYIANSLNKDSRNQNRHSFSVSITFSDVQIPEFTAKEVKIKRTYDTLKHDESVEILLDGKEEELYGQMASSRLDEKELFIREFILPLEIAKFFFFDAEKIVALAEVNKVADQRSLSRAYSEVLGIKKYEDLRLNLESVREKFKRDSASREDTKKFNNLEAEIKNELEEKEEYEIGLREIDNEIETLEEEIEGLQNTILREGNQMTEEEVFELRQKENVLREEKDKIQEGLKEFYDLIPFGVSGKVLAELWAQLEDEKAFRNSQHGIEVFEEKSRVFLQELEDLRHDNSIYIERSAYRFIEEQIEGLIKKHFFESLEGKKKVQVLHGWSQSEHENLKRMISDLKSGFISQFRDLFQKYNTNKIELERIKKRIKKAETLAESSFLKSQKQQLHDKKQRLAIKRETRDELIRKIAEVDLSLAKNRKLKTQLADRVKVSQNIKPKDEAVRELILNLKDIIRKVKEEKKKSLETRMLKNLKRLMHKRAFIKSVEVDISSDGEAISINLYGKDGKTPIAMESLSMGERQLYASSLLMALVDESEIEFPVFIDSPMQKFDMDHSVNIVKHFYPKVSHQVILFPLVGKEMTLSEYEMLEDNVERRFAIKNLSTYQSTVEELDRSSFIEEFNLNSHAAN